MDSKIDRRKSAEPYKKGEKPSARSEYFGKSYGQLKRESVRAKALEKAKGGKKKYPIGDDRNPQTQADFRRSNERRIAKHGFGARI